MNVADYLRAELLNYELEIAFAESRIAFFSARMERERGFNSPKRKRKFVLAKVMRDTYENYRQDLLAAKNSLAQGIDSALASYPVLHRQVFWEVILNEREPSEVATEMGMSVQAIERIAGKLKADLHRLYRQ